MTVTLASALRAGLQAHRAGAVVQAIAAYDAVLAIDPTHPTARHLRGFAILQLDRPDDARADLELAVRLAPDNANGWTHLAVCIDRTDGPRNSGDPARRALVLDPGAREAMAVLTGSPTTPDAVLRRLLALAPDAPEAWVRAGQRVADSAVGAGRVRLWRALCLAPDDPMAHLDLADLQRRGGRPELARRLASRALVLRPNDPRGLAERAAAATEMDDVAAALTDTARALLLDPGHAQAWGNRGETLYRIADYTGAVTAGTRAMTVAPDLPEVLANLGAYRLAGGDLRGGWPLFRHRPARRKTRGPDLARWSGEAGARLLVLAEQGLGDELLFSTLWRDLDRRVAVGLLSGVTVEADPRLIPLGDRAHPHLAWRGRFVEPEHGGEFTHWCLAGDLMEILRPEIRLFSDFNPGLVADPVVVDHWRHWLAATTQGRPAIGFCWRSGRLGGHRRRHYPDIADCRPLLSSRNKFFVALQYDDCRDELRDAPVGDGSALVLPPGLDRRDDQEGVAALMAALDLVVSADTAVLALAGALGVPAVGLALHPGWVGLGQREHPWFPSVRRIYRAPDVAWEETARSAADLVESRLASTGRAEREG